MKPTLHLTFPTPPYLWHQHQTLALPILVWHIGDNVNGKCDRGGLHV